jgi:hypothetical protein
VAVRRSRADAVPQKKIRRFVEGTARLSHTKACLVVAGKIALNRFVLPGKRRHDDCPFSFGILSIFLRVR